jgi:membrane protease YdiL (CAAX protease family)
LSSPLNPISPPGPFPEEESPPPATVISEDPSWSEWEVLQIAMLTVASIVSFLFLITFAAQRLLYANSTIAEVAGYPWVTVLAQLLAYFVVLLFMVSVVKRKPGESFWRAIRWDWPQSWSAYLFGGVILALALQGLAHFLPMPKELPIDRFFRTPREAWALSLFGVSLAPLLEEFFFRGFLYPVLARRLGVVLAILLTSIGFGLIHAPQLGKAWAPVLVVFLVGLALTITRAVTKSVAASLLMHVAYNGTISALIFAVSDGFRHLDKLAQ